MIKRLTVLLAGALVAAGLVVAAPASPAHAAGDKDCADFANQAAAQKYFLGKGGSPSNNVDLLDADGDGIACESNPCPCNYSKSGGGSGGGASTPAAQHSRVTVKKVKYGRHGWTIVATVTKNGKAWKYKSTVLQARVCGSFVRQAAKKTGPGGRARFVYLPVKGWNQMKVCGVTYPKVKFRVHVARQGKVPAANSRVFHVRRR